MHKRTTFERRCFSWSNSNFPAISITCVLNTQLKFLPCWLFSSTFDIILNLNTGSVTYSSTCIHHCRCLFVHRNNCCGCILSHLGQSKAEKIWWHCSTKQWPMSLSCLWDGVCTQHVHACGDTMHPHTERKKPSVSLWNQHKANAKSLTWRLISISSNHWTNHVLRWPVPLKWPVAPPPPPPTICSWVLVSLRNAG